MSDTSPRDQSALTWNAKKRPARQPKPGEEVWRLKNVAGRIQSCELRDNSAVGAGWDVMLLEDGEPLFSRRCADETLARYAATAMEQDLRRTGSTDAAIEKGGA
jgi:hypothetical protein